MSADAPADDLDYGEENWDEARVLATVTDAVGAGRTYIESAARDRSTGSLVGFTTVTVSSASPDLAYQWDTLVLREHRGFGLGIRLKAANTLVLMREQPNVTRIRTYNAASNQPMLEVNRARGYWPEGTTTVWHKPLIDATR